MKENSRQTLPSLFSHQCFHSIGLTEYCDKASYNPFIDAIYFPKLDESDQIAETIFKAHEACHRLLTGAHLKCRMRIFTEYIYGMLWYLPRFPLDNQILLSFEANLTDKTHPVIAKYCQKITEFDRSIQVIFDRVIYVDEVFATCHTIFTLEREYGHKTALKAEINGLDEISLNALKDVINETIKFSVIHPLNRLNSHQSSRTE